MYKLITHLFATSCFLFCVPASGGTIYVDPDSGCSGTCGPQGQGDCGGTWGTACANLQPAIDAAGAGGHEVWVKEGSYAAIQLQDGARVYGGFAGDETNASQSDPETHKTYIEPTGGTRPVTGIAIGSATILRGFYIRNGSLDVSDYPEVGSGMYLENSSAMITQCVFEDNRSVVIGGGVAISGGSPTFVNCVFRDNDGGWSCGAVYGFGGAVPTFVNCLFYDNVAWQGGAVCNIPGASTFINCTFTENEGTYRGAIYDYMGLGVFRNCIFWSNVAARSRLDPFENTFGTTTATNSCIQDDDPDDGIVYGGTGSSNIDDPPQFAYPAGRNYRVANTSPVECRNGGDNAALPADIGDLDWDGDTTETLPLDLGLVPRVQEGIVGMGAYEYDGRPFYGDFTPKNRYVTLVKDNPGSRMALRVTLVESNLFPASEGHQWWVDTPYSVIDAGATIKVAKLRCGPVYVDWSGVNIVQISDREIVPDARYKVEAVVLGADLCDPASFSPLVLLSTSDVWGDIVGPFTEGAWPPPDGQVDQSDVDAIIEKLQSLSTAPPLVWCDVDPEVPNNIVDVLDALGIIASKDDPGHTYPYGGPGSCTCPSNCCNYGRCCKIIGACHNTLQTECTGLGATWTPGIACESNPCPGGGGGGRE